MNDLFTGGKVGNRISGVFKVVAWHKEDAYHHMKNWDPKERKVYVKALQAYESIRYPGCVTGEFMAYNIITGSTGHRMFVRAAKLRKATILWRKK